MTMHSRLCRAAFLLTLSVVTFVGCTSEEDLGGRERTSGSTISASEYCDNTRSPDARPGCESETMCRGYYACLVGLLAPKAADVFLSCQKPKICSGDDSLSECQQRVAQEAPLRVAESQRCFSRYQECAAGSTGREPFDDDLCRFVVGMKDEILTDYAQCFERACDEVPSCLHAVLLSRGLHDCPE